MPDSISTLWNDMTLTRYDTDTDTDQRREAMSKKRRTRTARLRAEQTAIKRRLERAVGPNFTAPVLGRANIAYEFSQRTKATAHGGMGAIAKLVDNVGLAGEIDGSLDLLKLHKPYYESDHVLNIAYNTLCGGQRLQ